MADAASYAPSVPRPPTKTVDSLRGRTVQTVTLPAADDAEALRAELMLDPPQSAVSVAADSEIGGLIDINIPYDAANHFHLTLYLIYSYPDADTSDVGGWVEMGRGITEAVPGGTRVKFRFATPANLPPTGPIAPQPVVLIGVPPNEAQWMLQLEQRRAGRTWEFPLQVRRGTGASLAEVVADLPETGKTAAPPIASSIIYHRPNPNWLALCEIAEDSPGTTAVWTLIGLVMAVIGWVVGGGGWFFVAFGLFILGCIIYSMGMRNDITIMEGFIVVRRWWFGFTLQKRTVAAENIEELKVTPHPALPPENSTWSLDALVKGESGVWLVEGMKDSRQAYVLRRWIDLILKKGKAGVALEGELPLDKFILERGE